MMLRKDFKEFQLVNRIISNEEVLGNTVIVVDENGINKGEINKRFAISLAKEKGFDLVQVSKNQNGVSVCKFADAGKLRFEASKNRTASKPIENKEMMFHLNTSSNDIKIKQSKIRSMLEKKCVVKFGIQLKGRERAFMSAAKTLLQESVTCFSDIAKWDELKVTDNIVFVVLKPNKEITHDKQKERSV